MRNRSAVDLVVLAITFTISVILVVTLVGVVVIEIVNGGNETTDALLEVESEILGVLVGALVGFIGGRGHGRSEALDVMREDQP